MAEEDEAGVSCLVKDFSCWRSRNKNSVTKLGRKRPILHVPVFILISAWRSVKVSKTAYIPLHNSSFFLYDHWCPFQPTRNQLWFVHLINNLLEHFNQKNKLIKPHYNEDLTCCLGIRTCWFLVGLSWTKSFFSQTRFGCSIRIFSLQFSPIWQDRTNTLKLRVTTTSLHC